MAAEKNGFVAPSITTLRKIMKPVISTDIMGNRNVEVKAVGARAEPALYHSHVRVPDAVRAAELEEEKVRTMQQEKEARLRRFQEEVKKRVRQISKTKRRQQLQNDFQLMEKQHSRIRSSLRASDTLTDRKDRVLQCALPAVSIQPPPSSAPSGKDEEVHLESGPQKKLFEKHNRQVHTFTSEARQKLIGRRVEIDLHDLEEELPGGTWTTSESLAAPRKMRDDSVEEESDDNRYLQEEEDDSEVMDRYRHITALGHGERSKSCSFPPHTDPAGDRRDTRKGQDTGGESEERQDENDDAEEDREYQTRLQRVKFNLRATEPRHSEQGSRKMTRKKGSSRRPASVPDLGAGVTEYTERRRQQQQKLNYRRLYSDLERQAVRDTQRRKKQRLQIQKIKKEKEEVRRQEEDKARRLVEPRDPVTGETSTEADLRQQMERSHLQEVLQEREEQRQKQQEMIRYLNALRSNLREKLNKQGRELPSLCCCGETLWDTHPDTCANNCFYYKNHRAYARALQSLLTSSEIM